MLDAAQQAADFKRALDNIKSRNIQAVAARMCRVLREFPSEFTERSMTVVNDGEPVELDLSGTLYDSVWEENIGSMLVKNMALTPSLAIDAIESLYKFNHILVEHGSEILSGTEDELFSTEFTTIYNRVYRMLISPDYSAAPTLTYSQKGFTLNPKKFQDIEEFPDTLGVYELGKYISRTDIITQLRIMHGYVSSKVWQESTKLSVSVARSYAVWIEKAVLCVIDTILDIAHAVDGIATCSNKMYGEKEVPIDEFDPAMDGRYFFEIGIQPTSWVGAFSINSAGTYQISIVCEYPYTLHNLIIGGVENYPPVTSSVEGTGGRAIYLTEDITINGKTNVTYRIRPLQGHGGAFDSSKFKIYVRQVDSYVVFLDMTPDTPSTTFEDTPVAWTGNKFYPPTYGKYRFILTYKSYTITSIQYKGSNVSYSTATVDNNKVSATAAIDVTDISYPIVINFNQSGTFDPNNIVSYEFHTIPAVDWEDNEYTVPVTTEDQIIYVKTKNDYTVDAIKSNGVAVTKYKLSDNIWMAKLTSRSSKVTIDYGPGIVYGSFDPTNVVYVKFTNVPITDAIANSLKPYASYYPVDVTNMALTGSQIRRGWNGVDDDTWYLIGAMAIFPVIGPPGEEPIAEFSVSFKCFHEDIDHTFGDTSGTETTPINMKRYSSTAKKNGVYYLTNTYTSYETNPNNGEPVENLQWVQITVSNTGSLSASTAREIAKLLGVRVYITHTHTIRDYDIGPFPYIHRWNMTKTAADDKFTASTTTKSVPSPGTWQVDNRNQSDWHGTTIKSAQYKVKWGLKENIIYSTYKYPDKFHFRIKSTLRSKITRIELRIKGTEFCKSVAGGAGTSYATYEIQTSTVDRGYDNYEFDIYPMDGNNGLVDFDATPFVVSFYGTITAAELNNAASGVEWWFDGTVPADPTKRTYKWLTTMLRRTTKLKTDYGPSDAWDSNGYPRLKLVHSPLIGSDGFRSTINDEHWKYRYNKKWGKIETEIASTARIAFHTSKGISTYLSDFEAGDFYVSRELDPIAASVGEVLNVIAHKGDLGSAYDPEGNPGFTFNDDLVFSWIRDKDVLTLPSWRRQTTGEPPQKASPSVDEKEAWNLAHIFRVPKPGLYLLVNTQYKDNIAATLPAKTLLYTSTATKAEMDANTTFSAKKALFTAWPTMVAGDWLYVDSDKQKTVYLLDLRYDSTRDDKPITYFLFDTSASVDYYRHISFIRLTDNIV